MRRHDRRRSPIKDQAARAALRTIVPSGLVAAMVLGACGLQSAPEKWQSNWGGSLETYEAILSETDCDILHSRVRNAAAQANLSQPGTDDHRLMTGIMLAGFHRMVIRGCPEAYARDRDLEPRIETGQGGLPEDMVDR